MLLWKVEMFMAMWCTGSTAVVALGDVQYEEHGEVVEERYRRVSTQPV